MGIARKPQRANISDNKPALQALAHHYYLGSFYIFYSQLLLMRSPQPRPRSTRRQRLAASATTRHRTHPPGRFTASLLHGKKATPHHRFTVSLFSRCTATQHQRTRQRDRRGGHAPDAHPTTRRTPSRLPTLARQLATSPTWLPRPQPGTGCTPAIPAATIRDR